MASCANVALYPDNFGAVASCVEVARGFSSLLPPGPQRFAIRLPEIRFDQTVFHLASPLYVDLYEEEGAWYCAAEGDYISARGATREEAVQSFCEDFAVLWRAIAELPDEELAQDARKMKAFLRGIVKEIGPG